MTKFSFLKKSLILIALCPLLTLANTYADEAELIARDGGRGQAGQHYDQGRRGYDNGGGYYGGAAAYPYYPGYTLPPENSEHASPSH